jgi:hypothetical protein
LLSYEALTGRGVDHHGPRTYGEQDNCVGWRRRLVKALGGGVI